MLSISAMDQTTLNLVASGAGARRTGKVGTGIMAKSAPVPDLMLDGAGKAKMVRAPPEQAATADCAPRIGSTIALVTGSKHAHEHLVGAEF